MSNLAETQRKRFEFLNYVYTESEGAHDRFLSLSDVARALDMDYKEANRIAQYLVGENLIKVTWVMGDGRNSAVSITHWGVTQVETALGEPAKSTQYFPPAVNIINIQQMYGSQIQQGAQESTQTGTFSPSSMQDMIDVIGQVKDELAKISLSEEKRAEAEAEIQTLEAQAKSPHPKRAILRESWTALRKIAESVGSAVLIEIIKQQLLLPGV